MRYGNVVHFPVGAEDRPLREGDGHIEGGNLYDDGLLLPSVAGSQLVASGFVGTTYGEGARL